VEAYAHLGQFAGRASFSTWLTKIAVYEALSRARRQARRRTAPLPETDEGTMSTLRSSRPDPEQQAAQQEARALLESGIQALPASYRCVLVLRDVEGMSTAETAECLDLSEEVVKTRLHRARALLRDELFDRAGVTAPAAFSFHLSRCDRVVDGVFALLGIGAERPQH
jgi:RNA polymerase sigma-70 factor (ECF subfamily)